MRKFLLFVTTVFLSLFLINNRTYAQVHNYPSTTIRVQNPFIFHMSENANTYEYHVIYLIYDVYLYDGLEEDDYFLVTYHYIPLHKGLNRNTNSYELIGVNADPVERGTEIDIRVTLLKSFVNDNYPDGIIPFFRDNSALYVTYSIDNQYNIGYNDGYLAGRDDGYNDGYQNGLSDGERIGYQDGYDAGHRDGYYAGRSDGYNRGYNDGYDEGYEDGYNDFNVADYFGTNNIAKDPDISYGTASLAFEPSTAAILINKGPGVPNILLDKPYLIVIIKKNIYDYVTVYFGDGSLIYHYEATYHDIDDYDIYVFDFSDRINTKYRLEILKENVTTSEQINKFLNDVKDNLYFSHASRLLTSSLASQFYYFGYLVGLEENITDNDAYRIGFDNGYNRGYNEGNEDGFEQGFEEGYNQGFEYGKTVEYEQGYNDGYNDGYNEGIKEPFYSNFDKWIVPAIIIVVIAGIFVGYRRERYGGD